VRVEQDENLPVPPLPAAVVNTRYLKPRTKAQFALLDLGTIVLADLVGAASPTAGGKLYIQCQSFAAQGQSSGEWRGHIDRRWRSDEYQAAYILMEAK
jgi:hypothetical protein